MRAQRGLTVDETLQHTSCLNCGKLIFDRCLKKCPKCGGHVVLLSDEDLGLMSRRMQPVTKYPLENE
jgi:predicted RNA-binding Zn-ribbon protein involved in translation (DUF1610 family)